MCIDLPCAEVSFSERSWKKCVWCIGKSVDADPARRGTRRQREVAVSIHDDVDVMPVNFGECLPKHRVSGSPQTRRDPTSKFDVQDAGRNRLPLVGKANI